MSHQGGKSIDSSAASRVARPARLGGTLLLLALTACSRISPERLWPVSLSQPTSCNAPFTNVLHEGNGGRPEQFLVITNQNDWCTLWDRIYSFLQPAPPCDTGRIDFAKEAALVAASSVPDTCADIAITCVQRDAADNLTILYRISSNPPTPGVLCGAMFTPRVHVVKVNLPVGLATFVEDRSHP